MIRSVSAAWAVALLSAAAPQDRAPEFDFKAADGKVVITHGGKPVATYVHGDPRIRRPYFAHLHEPGGVQVTRNHPPIAGKDATDHAEFHPGLWLAFGDLSGHDSWRLKAPVVHDCFVEAPRSGPRGGFVVRNLHKSTDGRRTLCAETTRFTFTTMEKAYLLMWESTFLNDSAEEAVFGDQEEMGLGVRVATPLTADGKGAGALRDSEGRTGGKQIWGKAAAWCDFSGKVGGRTVGVALMAHPDNSQQTRFHARDYGLLVANPFAIAAFKAGPKSVLTLRRGKELRLRYGVLLHGGAEVAAAHREFLNALKR